MLKKTYSSEVVPTWYKAVTLVTWSGSECFLHSSFSFLRLSSQVCGCALSRLGLLGFAGTPTISLLSHTSKHWNYNEVLVFLHRGHLSQGPFHSQPHWRKPYPYTIHHPNHHLHPQLQHFEHWTKKTVSSGLKHVEMKNRFPTKGRKKHLTTPFLDKFYPTLPDSHTSCKSTIGGNSTASRECPYLTITSWDCYVCCPDFCCRTIDIHKICEMGPPIFN